jgi:thiol-disulfide isomerase/thioredoxin
MPNWLRNTLLVLVMMSCAIIGARLYIELNANQPDSLAVQIGAVSAPDQLPEFSLRDIYGDMQSISQWSGKPLLINFWATWCAPCRREMPLLQTLHTEQSRTGLQVVGIAIDRQADVARYITESGISYPILWGEGDAVAVSDSLGVPEIGLPFTLLVSSDNQILTLYVGELMREQLATMAEVAADVAAGKTDVATARTQLNNL